MTFASSIGADSEKMGMIQSISSLVAASMVKEPDQIKQRVALNAC